MKIKNDFVTNSSSSCFIVTVEPDEVEGYLEYITELAGHPDAVNEGVACYFISTEMQELSEFTNGRPYDWASKPMGMRFWNMSEGEFNMCKGIIESGAAAAYTRVDWNVCSLFRRDWGDRSLEDHDC